MATFKDLQDRIALDYLNRMTLIPEVKRAIQNSIKCYEGMRYWFNEATTAVATVSSQTYITVPADFLALDRLEVTINNADYKLSERSFAEIRQMDATRYTGQPTDFAYYGDRFELAAVPDSAYSVNVYYIKSLPALSADTDSNAWTNEAANLIAHHACVDLLSTVLQADYRAIQHHVNMMQIAQVELDTRNALRLTTKIRATQF